MLGPSPPLAVVTSKAAACLATTSLVSACVNYPIEQWKVVGTDSVDRYRQWQYTRPGARSRIDLHVRIAAALRIRGPRAGRQLPGALGVRATSSHGPGQLRFRRRTGSCHVRSRKAISLRAPSRRRGDSIGAEQTASCARRQGEYQARTGGKYGGDHAHGQDRAETLQFDVAKGPVPRPQRASSTLSPVVNPSYGPLPPRHGVTGRRTTDSGTSRSR